MDTAGFVAPKAAEAAVSDAKPLHEMSSDELRGLVDKLESELGARALDVTPADNAHKSPPARAKPLAFLGYSRLDGALTGGRSYPGRLVPAPAPRPGAGASARRPR